MWHCLVFQGRLGEGVGWGDEGGWVGDRRVGGLWEDRGGLGGRGAGWALGRRGLRGRVVVERWGKCKEKGAFARKLT